MKVLKFFGWLFFPYILIFFRWKHLKVPSRVLFILWSIILLSGMVNSGYQQEPKTPISAPSVQVQSNNKPVTTPSKQISKPVSKQPSQDQILDQKVAQLKAEAQQLKNSKNATYQEKMKIIREYINIDKPSLLAEYPSVQDMGFAGNLFITTNKNSVQPLNSIGDQFISQQANGVYWKVEIDLSDVGTNPMQVSSDIFTLITSDGRTFSTDTKAEMMISKPILMDTLNPGVDDVGYLIFDMPKDIKISDVMLNVQNGFNNVKLTLS